MRKRSRGDERHSMERHLVRIRVAEGSQFFLAEKRPGMTCSNMMKKAGLVGYELFVEASDFPIGPDETLDFVEEGQTLFARPLNPSETRYWGQ